MKFLLNNAGSHGDILPLIAIGKGLQARGHEVKLWLHELFVTPARAAGLDAQAVGDSQTAEALFHHPDMQHERKAHPILAQAFAQFARDSLPPLQAELARGPAVLIGGPMALAPLLLGEITGSPAVVLHFAPILLRSRWAVPRFAAIQPPVPAWFTPLLWWGIDRWVMDPVYGAPFNGLRTELGLPTRRPLSNYLATQNDLALGLFPPWYAPPQLDWPKQTCLSHFPLEDLGAQHGLPPKLEEFLQAGAAPIGFTPGTFTGISKSFFASSIQATQALGARAILLTRFADQIPQPLPATILHVDYAPFSSLLPRLAAFVHHGGIGTTSQALRAGVPQLIRPLMGDQFDNAQRARRLGVAAELRPWRYRSGAVARKLHDLTQSTQVKQACAEIAQSFVHVNGVELACDLILKKFATS